MKLYYITTCQTQHKPWTKHHFQTSGWKLRKWHCPLPTLHPFISYLLGLLAMIKCSICSYQCDKWNVSNWRLACHINFCSGSVFLSLLHGLHVLLWHGTAATSATYKCCLYSAVFEIFQTFTVKRTRSRISFYKKSKPLTQKEMKLTSSNCTSKLPCSHGFPPSRQCPKIGKSSCIHRPLIKRTFRMLECYEPAWGTTWRKQSNTKKEAGLPCRTFDYKTVCMLPTIKQSRHAHIARAAQNMRTELYTTISVKHCHLFKGLQQHNFWQFRWNLHKSPQISSQIRKQFAWSSLSPWSFSSAISSSSVPTFLVLSSFTWVKSSNCSPHKM